MSWLGIADDTIRKWLLRPCVMKSLISKYEKKKFVTFKKKELPKNTHRLEVWLEKYVGQDLTETQYQRIDSILNYLRSRGVDPDWYDFMYSPDNI
jgi:hypothetical protein